MMTPGFSSACAKTESTELYLGWDMLDLLWDRWLDSDLLSGHQDDLVAFCIIYDWLYVRFRIAHLAQDGRFSRICFADDQDAKLRALLADLLCR